MAFDKIIELFHGNTSHLLLMLRIGSPTSICHGDLKFGSLGPFTVGIIIHGLLKFIPGFLIQALFFQIKAYFILRNRRILTIRRILDNGTKYFNDPIVAAYDCLCPFTAVFIFQKTIRDGILYTNNLGGTFTKGVFI